MWKAEADDLNGHDGLTRLVAVKTIKESASQKEKQELLHEIYIMQKIGTHPNVVTILACCTEQGLSYNNSASIITDFSSHKIIYDIINCSINLHTHNTIRS